MAQAGQSKLSIVVIFYNMTREASRTLYTLSTKYQRDVRTDDYDIIAIDNGSSTPLGQDFVKSFGPNFDYNYFETESVSPVGAINFGARHAKGEYVAIIVDGARMVTPGLIRQTLDALDAFPNPFVCSLAWHLGPDVQNKSMLDGYNQATEDSMLASINWRDNGYSLFEVSTLAQSSNMRLGGGMPRECSWFAMERSAFLDMNGYDERFQTPGGGLVNHEFLERLAANTKIEPVVLQSEGTFHQFHGGVATNVGLKEHPWAQFAQEYESLFGRSFKRVDTPKPHYWGDIPPEAKKFKSAALN